MHNIKGVLAKETIGPGRVALETSIMRSICSALLRRHRIFVRQQDFWMRNVYLYVYRVVMEAYAGRIVVFSADVKIPVSKLAFQFVTISFLV